MNCPVCRNTQLVMTERQGVEIDYCPQCRGVWLDRGELDKIIERTTAVQPAVQFPPANLKIRGENHNRQHDKKYDKHHDKHGYEVRGDYYHKKKKSFLSDLFD